MSEKQRLHDMYWKDDMTLQEIADELDWSYCKTYYRFRRKHKIDTHRSLWARELDFDLPKLRICLRNKWTNIIKRTNGEDDTHKHYDGLPTLREREYISFCNKHKSRILQLWRQYLKSGHDHKYAVSLDRIDNSKGYTPDNIHFVVNGYNSWKNHLTPVRVTKDGDTQYFSSPTEAGRYWGVRPGDIAEVLRDGKYNRHNVKIEHISIQDLLDARSCESLLEYYHTVLNW